MDIHGFTKTTLLDFPGHVACTVFTAGCNFRCPFCHNGNLVLHPDLYPTVDEAAIFNHISKRRNIITGLCISGGEPTLQPDLLDFMARVKRQNILIKLDTNGYRPDILKDVIQNGLADYIAMDIKAGRNNYSKASGIAIDISQIEMSVDILKSSGLPFEFRTTCVSGIHTNTDFEDIADWLPSDCLYFLQSYKENDAVPDKSCASFGSNELNEFLNILKPSIPNATLRGID
ncbi:MAG: anaerobic ribonucleoside-triphosphate reductase activating protein [Lachnospiraceae bacterium]|nr:anaerobic ribonucleoside-triphosphate reductase activating protein [Candidatus Colinaster scatohippi]